MLSFSVPMLLVVVLLDRRTGVTFDMTLRHCFHSTASRWFGEIEMVARLSRYYGGDYIKPSGTIVLFTALGTT